MKIRAGIFSTAVWLSLAGGALAQQASSYSPTLGAAGFANPSASVGTSATNGSALTAMRSDAAPAISLSIAPTWTGAHIFSGQPVTISGNQSVAAWTTAGTKLKLLAATLTDTTSSGTVTVAASNVFAGDTIASSSATTYTFYGTLQLGLPAQSGSATITRPAALLLGGAMYFPNDGTYPIGAAASGRPSAIFTSGAVTAGGAFTGTTATLTTLATDAAHTDNTVCADTSTGLLYKGSGTIGICLGTSSIRYKHDVRPLIPGLREIMQLKTVSYFYKHGYGDDGALPHYGFIAEDVVKVLPKTVGLDANGEPNSVDYVAIIPVLVKAVQEQQREIRELWLAIGALGMGLLIMAGIVNRRRTVI